MQCFNRLRIIRTVIKYLTSSKSGHFEVTKKLASFAEITRIRPYQGHYNTSPMGRSFFCFQFDRHEL